MDGNILRILLHEGESFSTFVPKPILTIADKSNPEVRSEIDEYDVPKVRIGQRAQFWQDGSPDRRFSGTVVRTMAAMGHLSVVSGNPADKTDRDVLEVIVVPDVSQKAEVVALFPIGLRLTVRFDSGAGK